MVYRPVLFSETFVLRRKAYPHLALINGPNSMNIRQPLSRASDVAELTHQRCFHDLINVQPRYFAGYYPSFKSRGLYSYGPRNARLGLSRRHFTTAPLKIKNKTRNLHRSLLNRFFSAEARQRRREKRRFVRWWTLTSIAVVLGGVAARISYERGEEVDENEQFHQYTIRPQSWQLYAYQTLPLKTISRLWGQVNSIQLPVWLRSPSYHLYSALFGVNLDEMEDRELSSYRNLSEFFYRKLRPGARTIEDSELVSPSDGKVLKFGVIQNGEIEQVKDMTYSIDALLGLSTKRFAAPTHQLVFEHDGHTEAIIRRDEEFAKLNGISYSLDDILGGENEQTHHIHELEYEDKGDGTVKSSRPSLTKGLSVARKLAPTPSDLLNVSSHSNLYFAVIYLAPGDYHRYHSPANWVTTLRRHFIGELFSVAPFFQKTLKGLFVLNERVALLGYWKYGFFSMIPVGATNVGSIVVNFDKDLKTNDKYEHKVYTRGSDSSDSETQPLLIPDDASLDSETTLKTASSLKSRKVKKNTVYEATYTNASSLLGGFPLSKGEEVGGFKLGSTVVLVFEAPDNFEFDLEVGQKIKMGQTLGGFK